MPDYSTKASVDFGSIACYNNESHLGQESRVIMPTDQPTTKPITPTDRFDATSGSNPVYGVGWLGDAMRQLDAIEKLPDGWDSHDSSRPEMAVVRKGAKLLALLWEADARLPKPHIAPTPSGGVQFCWESGHCYLEIEVLDRDLAQFYFVDREAHSEATAEFPSATLPDSVLAYARFFSRHDV